VSYRKGRTIGLLRLAFKPHTDDLRDAPAYDIARVLIDAHDPVAIAAARFEQDLAIVVCGDAQKVFPERGSVLLVTQYMYV